jgi:hypothetical protein
MKRFVQTTATLLLFCLAVHAQTFNYELVALKYKMPARTPFTTAFETVTVRFHGEEHLKRYGILSSELTSAGDFKFERYKNIAEAGDLHLDVFVGQPQFLGVEKLKEVKKENEKDVTYHYHRGTFITPMSYELRDGARNLIEEKIVFSAADFQYFTTQQYTSALAMITAWSDNSKTIITQKLEAGLRHALTTTAKTVRDRYDDVVISDKINMFDIKKPEKIGAEYLNTAFSKITSTLAQKPLITDWDAATRKEVVDLLTRGTKLSAEDNDQRIGYAIAHYNLALLHAVWNDFTTARDHLAKGRKADRKNYEFDQLEKFIATFANRGVPDEISSKAYTARYQAGMDSKLPPMGATGTSSQVEASAPKERSVDTVYAKNGDTIVGFVQVVHVIRKINEDQLHDFSHLIIHPLNMPQEEIKLPAEELYFIRHKNKYMAPFPTKILLTNLTHLYEPIKSSKDEKLRLFRTAYHESMPYKYSQTDMMAYIYTLSPTGKGEDAEILPISSGTKYALGFNGALANDFEFCPNIATKAKGKLYKNEEASLIVLVEDYDKCKE